MTEVPEHLLRRSAERRAALAGEAPPADAGDSGGSAASAGGGDSGGGAVEAAPAAAAAAPARAAAPSYTGPPQLPPRKQRVPMWAMPVLVAMPLWAFLYAGAFGERTVPLPPGPVQEGAALYRSNCSSCHGATGGGSSGPALTDVLATFADFESHINWVKTGSQPSTGREYAPGKVSSGGMPPFEGQLDEAQILAVVCYERVQFGGLDPVPEQCTAEGAAGAEGGEAEGGGQASG